MALFCPVKVSYWLAERLADIKRHLSKDDTQAVKENLRIILGDDKDRIDECTKHIFRNFAKYLVDFFRFEKITPSFITSNVKIYGRENLDNALKKGKGAIILTAHIGNWELGGVVAALSGYNFYAVALNHKNPKIDKLFKKQRAMKGVHVIPPGIALRKCFEVLKGNNVLALLGDRNFSKNGVNVEFFNKTTSLPTGPAYLSAKLGSPVVPGFFIRVKDDKFILFFEEPIDPSATQGQTNKIEFLTKQYVKVLERFIRTYPEQWYLFRRFWEAIVSWESEF